MCEEGKVRGGTEEAHVEERGRERNEGDEVKGRGVGGYQRGRKGERQNGIKPLRRLEIWTVVTYVLRQ